MDPAIVGGLIVVKRDIDDISLSRVVGRDLVVFWTTGERGDSGTASAGAGDPGSVSGIVSKAIFS